MPKLTTHQKLGQLKKIPFTKEGYAKLLAQLENLKLQRPAAVKELARARELGDLSENGLYTAAKARLNSIDNQIFRAEMTIKFADVVSDRSADYVSIGSKVTTVEDGKETVYTIVGDTETNPKENKVSQHSPIGRALMGKTTGDKVVINLPSGQKTFSVRKIS